LLIANALFVPHCSPRATMHYPLCTIFTIFVLCCTRPLNSTLKPLLLVPPARVLSPLPPPPPLLPFPPSLPAFPHLPPAHTTKAACSHH
jgi:hypothetical protein